MSQRPDELRAVDDEACIFCGKRGEPLSREHIIPKWLARVLMDMEPGDEQAWALHYTAGGLVDRDVQRPTRMPTVVVPCVCTDCNNGWMSALENRVKPFFEPMVRGQKVVLTLEQQVDLATWASKTVIAMEYHEPSTAVSTPEDRSLVRTERRPPHHHRARLAHRDEMHESLIVKTLVARSEPAAADDPPDAFATLLVLGFCVIQVWGGHGTDPGPGLTQPGTKIGRAIMIWPPTMHAVEWPPVIPVPEEELDDLAREVIPWADDSPDLAEWRETRRQLDKS